MKAKSLNPSFKSISIKHVNPKILSLLILLILSFFFFVSCASEQSKNTQSQKSPNQIKTIVDCIGREVEIPVSPKRVSCMYAATAHIMSILDKGGDIVSVPEGVKTDELILERYPHIKNLAVPFVEGSINIEELVRIDADLVIVRISMAQNMGEVEKLENLGIPYIAIDFDSIDSLKNAVQILGQALNAEDKANAFTSFIDSTIKLVEERLSDVKPSQYPLVYHSVTEAIKTDTPGNICTEIMAKAKLKNAIEGKDLLANGNGTFVTLEEIFKWNPDAIVANESSVTSYILGDSKWSELRAVKNRHVYTMPVGDTRWNHPGSIEPHMGVLALALKFYPTKFKNFDIELYIKEYYSKFYDLSLDKAKIEDILSGKGMRKSNSAT